MHKLYIMANTCVLNLYKSNLPTLCKQTMLHLNLDKLCKVYNSELFLSLHCIAC